MHACETIVKFLKSRIRSKKAKFLTNLESNALKAYARVEKCASLLVCVSPLLHFSTRIPFWEGEGVMPTNMGNEKPLISLIGFCDSICYQLLCPL